MYMKHGKVVFGEKDTYSLPYTLNPIIGAALLKFKEVEGKSSYRHAAPNNFIEDVLGQEVQYTNDDEGFVIREVDEELMSTLWDECIDKMIFAFTSEEPDIMDYDFEMKIIKDSDKNLTFMCTDEVENKRYTEDVMEWQDKVNEGYLLFGKYLQNLWW